MGGAISAMLALTATVLFILSRSWPLATASGCVAAVCIWSWLHMRYFARLLARNRQFVEALNRQEIQEGTPEAQQYWQTMHITVEPSDVEDVPNWITLVNMIAAFAAVILVVWGLVHLWM
jgi:hypothetical protein